MANETFTQPSAHLFRYTIASQDMFYAEVGQRDICVCDDPGEGFRLWGEMPGAQPVNAVCLCQVFLEFALSCQTIRDLDRAYGKMKAFGQHIGRALAQHLQDCSVLETSTNPCACALECVLKSKNAHFTKEQGHHQVRFTITGCPFDEFAERAGLRNVELAHHGFNAMCKSLIHALNPDLNLIIAHETHAGHIASLTLSSGSVN